MLLNGFLKFLYLVILQKSFARTAILCMADGNKEKALTRQLYLPNNFDMNSVSGSVVPVYIV
jgi:predicted transcriptional regulator